MASGLNSAANYTTYGLQRVKDARIQMMARRKVAKMLIAVVVMFGFCFLPVHLLNILRSSTVLLTVLVRRSAQFLRRSALERRCHWRGWGTMVVAVWLKLTLLGAAARLLVLVHRQKNPCH